MKVKTKIKPNDSLADKIIFIRDTTKDIIKMLNEKPSAKGQMKRALKHIELAERLYA